MIHIDVNFKNVKLIRKLHIVICNKYYIHRYLDKMDNKLSKKKHTSNSIKAVL